MSFPDVVQRGNPGINLTKDNVIDILLTYVAVEEFGLAHMMEAQSKKVRSTPGMPVQSPNIDDMEKADKTVETIFGDIIKKEMLLQHILENILHVQIISATTTTTDTTTTTAPV